MRKKSADYLPNASRRHALKQGLASAVALTAGPLLSACDDNVDNLSAALRELYAGVSNISRLGPLDTVPDSNGFLLPAGFKSRVVAKTDLPPVSSSNYIWHGLPDGGATFTPSGGGWIYVSNSELNTGGGGVGALEFDQDGKLIDAFQLLSGTSKNCAGGPTPWDTWLSCEEVPTGMVWECFPLERGMRSAIRRDAMGVFQHEAAATDPVTSIVYLTEDRPDGCLYRFIPDRYGDLSAGVLQAAVVDRVDADQVALEGRVTWTDIPDPTAATLSVREQARLAGAGIFRRGEGAAFHAGTLYFSTTVDAAGGGQVWSLSPGTDGMPGELSQIYNRVDLFPEDDTLNGVDNLTVSAGGDVLVAEDSDDMQVQAITPDGLLVPLFKLLGHQVFNFPGEITGPAFDPSGTRLYFSSQKGTEADFLAAGKPVGMTYEITGPFVS